MKTILKPKPPFSFDLYWKFFSWNRPSPEIYENGVWKRAIRLKSGKIVPMSVKAIGSVDKPGLELSIFSKLIREEKRELMDKVRWIFNTDYDLAEVYDFMERDPILEGLKQKLYGLKPFNYSTVFEGVVKSIIQQQISLIGSRYITTSLIEKFGEIVKIENGKFYEFPTPSTLAKASLRRLRMCGLSKQKASYIKGLAKEVVKGKFDFESLKELPSDEIIEILMDFKGIGRWTAELVVVTSTGKDALPADDLGARRAVSNFYFNGNLISANELRKFTKRWGKFRSIITYYLICAELLRTRE